VKLGLGVAAGPDPGGLASLGAEAEALGYAAIWSNDSPAGDGLLQLSLWARASKDIDLGVGVLALDRHQPVDIAARVAELQLPRERLLLGIGAGLQSHPLGAVRAGAGELRRLLPGVRLAVAAMGPKMCQLAGELADAVLLNWMTPERIAWAIPLVRQGAAAVGKPDIPVDAHIRVAMGADAEERLAREAGFYAQLPAYARNFESIGGDPASIGIAVAEPADLRSRLAGYSALDLAVVRPLSERSPEAILEVARAAIG
jgi:alkanesulfonate monooxygenase SsuD/methylene tetrahydromethanopterin reductase-like flavin-dependent oxidoreductase (luciferase family)